MAYQGLGIEPQPTMGATLLNSLGQGLGQIGQQVQQGGAQQANLALAIRQQQQNQNMQLIQTLGLVTQMPSEYRAIFTKQMEGQADPAVLDLMKKLDSKDAQFIFNHPSIQSYIKDPNALAQAPLHIQKLIPAMLQLHQYNQMQEALEDLQADINPGGGAGKGTSSAPVSAPFPSQTAMPAPPGLPPGLGGGEPPAPGLGGGMPGPSMFQPQPAPQPPAGPGNAAGMQPGSGMVQPRFLPLNGGQGPGQGPQGQGQGPSGGGPMTPGPAAGTPPGQGPGAASPSPGNPLDLADQMESQALSLTTRAAKLDMIAAYNPSIRYAADGLRNQAKVLQDRADRHRGMTGGVSLEIPNPFTGEGNVQVRYNGYGQLVNVLGSAKQDLQMVNRIDTKDGMVHQFLWDKNNPQLGMKDQGIAPQSAGDVRIAAALRAKGLTPGTKDWDIQFQNQRRMVPVGPGGNVYGGADLIGFTGSETPSAPGGATPGAAPAGGGAAPSPAPAGAPGSGAATTIQGPNGLTATVRPAGAPAQTAQAPAPKPVGPKPLISRPRELPEGAVKDLASVDSLLKHIDDLKDRAKTYDNWLKMNKFAAAPTVEKYTKMHWLDDEERDFQSRLDRLRLNVDRTQGGLSIFRSPKALEMLNTIIGNPWQPGLPVRLNAAQDQLNQERKDFTEKLRKSNFAVPD